MGFFTIYMENTLEYIRLNGIGRVHNNNQSETAKALGIGRVTLYRHLKE